MNLVELTYRKWVTAGYASLKELIIVNVMGVFKKFAPVGNETAPGTLETVGNFPEAICESSHVPLSITCQTIIS